VPVTKQLFGTIQLADGPHEIFQDQIDEWNRMFPNVCAYGD